MWIRADDRSLYVGVPVWWLVSALNSLICADVPLRNYSLTHPQCGKYHPDLKYVDGRWCERSKYIFVAVHLTVRHGAAAVLHPFAIDVVGIMYVCCSVCRILIWGICLELLAVVLLHESLACLLWQLRLLLCLVVLSLVFYTWY